MKVFMLLALLVSTSAYAMPEGIYTCKATVEGKKDIVTISFNWEDGELGCAVPDTNNEGEDYVCPEFFKYKPAEPVYYWLDGMYDGGYEIEENGDLLVSSDSDGCNIGELTLTSESEFTRGTVSSEFRCGTGKTERYEGELTCTFR